MKDPTNELLFLISLVAAKTKAEAVIDSCENYKHCIGARRYIDLFFEKFKDLEMYGELMKLYVDKSLQLSTK